MGDKKDDMIEALNKVEDMENLPLGEVFKTLMCSRGGLSTEEAHRRLASFGYNKHEGKKESRKLKFLLFMIQPPIWVMTFAIIMGFECVRGEGRLEDWQNFAWIVALFILDLIISFIEKNNASHVAAAIMVRFGLKSKVLREGRWSEEDAGILVPGDIISIKAGDIVPADARLLGGNSLKIDESAVTGESSLVTKDPGATVYSMTICKEGETEAVVTSTGVRTSFSKSANQVGNFLKELTITAHFCVCLIAAGIIFTRLYDI